MVPRRRLGFIHTVGAGRVWKKWKTGYRKRTGKNGSFGAGNQEKFPGK